MQIGLSEWLGLAQAPGLLMLSCNRQSLAYRIEVERAFERLVGFFDPNSQELGSLSLYLGAIALVLAPATATLLRSRFYVGIVPRQPQLKDCPERTQSDDREQWKQISRHHYGLIPQVELNSPAKPMNAMDSMPAMIRFIAVPWISLGMFDNSDSSRRPASSTSASVKPIPAPSA